MKRFLGNLEIILFPTFLTHNPRSRGPVLGKIGNLGNLEFSNIPMQGG